MEYAATSSPAGRVGTFGTAPGRDMLISHSVPHLGRSGEERGLGAGRRLTSVSAGTRVFVARLAGTVVFDPIGDQVGRVRDVVVLVRAKGRRAPSAWWSRCRAGAGSSCL
nr:hypothetical protein GCM10025730_22730 [Promicromonospora thailandica]